VSLESFWWGGVHGLGFMTFGLVVQKFLNIEWFFHWKLNYIIIEKFRGIGMFVWHCWKDLDEWFNGIYLVRFWIQNVGDIDLKMIFVVDNSNKFQKTRLGRKNNLRTYYHLNAYHSIEVEEIVMCLWCCWKDFRNSNLMEFMFWYLDLRCGTMLIGWVHVIL